MARYYGNVGYGIPTDRGDGVWSDHMTERAYYGEVSNVTRSIQEADKVNNDIRLQHRISIVADAFAFENFAYIKYVSWMGSLWAVNTVEVERPRLLLTLGGAYNGERPTS
jgi:hypothetical protein